MPNILIIDDNLVTLETASSLLRADGFQTATASSGRTGIGLALSATFDVVLVDLHLPDISGVDVVQELKRKGFKAPMVIVTAFPELDSSFDAGTVGAAGYVDGPLFGDELINVVRQALNGPLPVHHSARHYMTGPQGHVADSSDMLEAVDSRIRQALKLIVMEPQISVSAIAERVDLSESRLRHLFLNIVGIPLTRLITDRQMALGAILLTTTHEPIGYIAERVGRTDFSKAFHARFGLSPSTYRRLFRHRTAQPAEFDPK